MKTIEDAVIELGGIYPVRESGVTVGDEVLLVQIDFSPEYPEDEIGSFHAGGFGCDYEIYRVVCTRSEFESCAKRLGYINGYLWGVEYPTNGKRPDLPDDVLVDVTHSSGRIYRNWIESWHRHSGITSFKVVDPRYKPISEISENNPDCESVSKSLDCKQNQPDISDLIVALSDASNLAIDLGMMDRSKEIMNICKSVKAKIEREKVIAAAMVVADNANPECDVTFLSVLYDAGMLVLPPNKSDTKD